MAILILLALVVIVIQLGMILSHMRKPSTDLSAIEDKLAEIETGVSDIKWNIESISERAESIDSAVSAIVRHWPDDYGIKVDATREARAEKHAETR
jgi:peptidoglycan hydrolase CwlO-like protein